MDDARVLVLIVQGLFAVVLLGVGFVLRALREDIKEMAREMKGFVTKAEAEPKWKRLHDIADRVIVLWTESGHVVERE